MKQTMRRTDDRTINRQQGAVLLVLAVLVSVIALGWLYAGMAGQHAADAVTSKTLAMAQAALIGRAVADANHPGSLPCPDTDNDGVAEFLVGVQCPSYIGRLPWRTLGLSDVRDGNGERLWYALSSDARDAQYQVVNSQATAGGLQVNDNAYLLAVLLSPGVALAAQQRDKAHENTVGNYLEGDNANKDNMYVAKPVTDAMFNDKLLALPSARLFRVVEKRVLQQIAQALAQYEGLNHAYPFAADQSGNAESNLLAGSIPYNTLLYAPSDVLVKNKWFDALAVSPLSPYSVPATLDQVQIKLEYCQGNMTRNTQMVVRCE